MCLHWHPDSLKVTTQSTNIKWLHEAKSNRNRRKKKHHIEDRSKKKKKEEWRHHLKTDCLYLEKRSTATAAFWPVSQPSQMLGSFQYRLKTRSWVKPLALSLQLQRFLSPTSLQLSPPQRSPHGHLLYYSIRFDINQNVVSFWLYVYVRGMRDVLRGQHVWLASDVFTDSEGKCFWQPSVSWQAAVIVPSSAITVLRPRGTYNALPYAICTLTQYLILLR